MKCFLKFVLSVLIFSFITACGNDTKTTPGAGSPDRKLTGGELIKITELGLILNDLSQVEYPIERAFGYQPPADEIDPIGEEMYRKLTSSCEVKQGNKGDSSFDEIKGSNCPVSYEYSSTNKGGNNFDDYGSYVVEDDTYRLQGSITKIQKKGSQREIENGLINEVSSDFFSIEYGEAVSTHADEFTLTPIDESSATFFIKNKFVTFIKNTNSRIEFQYNVTALGKQTGDGFELTPTEEACYLDGVQFDCEELSNGEFNKFANPEKSLAAVL